MAVCRRSSPASAAPRELFPAARDRFLTAFLAVFFRPVFFRIARFFRAFFFEALLRPDFFRAAFFRVAFFLTPALLMGSPLLPPRLDGRRGHTPKAIPQRAISSEAFREAARVPEFYLESSNRCDPQGSIRDADPV